MIGLAMKLFDCRSRGFCELCFAFRGSEVSDRIWAATICRLCLLEIKFKLFVKSKNRQKWFPKCWNKAKKILKTVVDTLADVQAEVISNDEVRWYFKLFSRLLCKRRSLGKWCMRQKIIQNRLENFTFVRHLLNVFQNEVLNDLNILCVQVKVEACTWLSWTMEIEEFV